MRLNVVSIEIFLIFNILCLRVSTHSTVKKLKLTNKSTSSSRTRNSAIFQCGISRYYGPAQRVVGGREARIGEFPWIVSVHSNGHFRCGGSILDAFHILTAAHCVKGAHPSEISIRYNSLLQSRNGSQRSALKLIIHPKYNIRTIDNDIALIRLKTSLVLSRINSGTDCLPSNGLRLAVGQSLTVSGWGQTKRFRSSNILRTTDVPLIPMTTCRKQYQHLLDLYTITDNMICAGLRSGGQDSCSV